MFWTTDEKIQNVDFVEDDYNRFQVEDVSGLSKYSEKAWDVFVYWCQFLIMRVMELFHTLLIELKNKLRVT